MMMMMFSSSSSRYSHPLLLVLLLLATTGTTNAQECQSVEVAPGAARAFVYAVDGTVETATASVTVPLCNTTAAPCNRLVFADRSWRPHLDDPAKVTSVSSTNSTTTAARFGSVGLCEPTTCPEGSVLWEAYVNVRGQVPVTLTVQEGATTVLEETTEGDLSYVSGCVPDTCLTMTASAASTPLYSSGRVILDGVIVLDQTLPLGGSCSYPMGAACTKEALGYDALLGVEVTTRGAGPYSPLGVSYGLTTTSSAGDDSSSARSLTPLSSATGFEGGDQTYKNLYNLKPDDCASMVLMNKYAAGDVDVVVTLDGEVVEGQTKDQETTFPLGECTEWKKSSIPAGGVAGIIIACIVGCCCIAAILNYVNEFYTDNMAEGSGGGGVGGGAAAAAGTQQAAAVAAAEDEDEDDKPAAGDA